MRSILHVDMNQFYAAVEIRDNPLLKGKPVIIGADPRGGRGRGVVSTASYEARRFGVHSAQPISQAWQCCPQGVFLPVDMAKYAEVSAQINAVFLRYTPLVEALSLDEAFLDVTASRGLFGEAKAIAQKVKDDILHETRLTCSAGVAPNKFLAKIASDLVKPDGLVVVEAGHEREFLDPLAIGRLWGVGEKTEPVLKHMGIHTIGDLARFPVDALRKKLGNQAGFFKALSLGLDDRPVEPSMEAKSIGRENTFERDTRDPVVLKRTLAELAEDVALRLRQDSKEAGLLTLKLRWSGFETHTRQAALKPPTDHGPKLLALGKKLLEHFLAQSDRNVRLIGLSAGHMVEKDQAYQPGLFDAPRETDRRVDTALDKLNEKFGEGTLKRASQMGGKGQKRETRNKTGFSRN